MQRVRDEWHIVVKWVVKNEQLFSMCGIWSLWNADEKSLGLFSNRQKLFRSVMGISDVMQEMSKELMKSGSSMAFNRFNEGVAWKPFQTSVFWRAIWWAYKLMKVGRQCTVMDYKAVVSEWVSGWMNECFCCRYKLFELEFAKCNHLTPKLGGWMRGKKPHWEEESGGVGSKRLPRNLRPILEWVGKVLDPFSATVFFSFLLSPQPSVFFFCLLIHPNGLLWWC